MREGVSRADDMLPYKVMHEPIPDGPHKGMHCPPDELEGMKNEFYGIRGWDENGFPTATTLERLKLDDVPKPWPATAGVTARVENERCDRFYIRDRRRGGLRPRPKDHKNQGRMNQGDPFAKSTGQSYSYEDCEHNENAR